MNQRHAGREPDEDSWAQAVSRAEDHVRLEASGATAADRPLPGRGPLVLLAGLVVMVSVAVISPRLVRAPEPGLSSVQQASDLRAEVGRVVEQIEAYREERGVLPAPAMLAPFLENGYQYRVLDRATLRYEVRRSAGGVEVVFDGSLPLNLWLLLGQSSGTTP